MKTINLFLASAVLGLMVQTTFAQTTDTTKNKVEIKKKTKVGVNGRQVTKIKMESKGTPEAVTGAVENAVTGAPKKVVTQVQPANPTVVVVRPEPAVKATATTTAAVKTPVTTTRTTTTTANVRRVSTSRPVKRKTTTTVSRPIASSTTTTTTTVKKD